jgi:hypothetical protein
MPKKLEEAIGCWTTDPQGLAGSAKAVADSIYACAEITRRNRSPRTLLCELKLLDHRLEVLANDIDTAVRRCREVISARAEVTSALRARCERR